MKEPKKQNIVRQLSSCLIEKFNKKKKKNLSLLILFTNQPNIQKLNLFVITPKILQKLTPIFTQLKIKTNVFLVVTNVTIAEKIF